MPDIPRDIPLLSFPDPDKERRVHRYEDFPVGSRVAIMATTVDFHFFKVGETGTVVKNTGQYLGISVEFDIIHWIGSRSDRNWRPRPEDADNWKWAEEHAVWCWKKTNHGFNPQHLLPLNFFTGVRIETRKILEALDGR